MRGSNIRSQIEKIALEIAESRLREQLHRERAARAMADREEAALEYARGLWGLPAIRVTSPGGVS